jgi:hypothetical protein
MTGFADKRRPSGRESPHPREANSTAYQKPSAATLPIWFVAFAVLFTLPNLRGVETSARINQAFCTAHMLSSGNRL